MVKVSLPHVTIRKSNQTYLYRRVVPPKVQAKLGNKNWFKTWPVGTDMATVARDALALSRHHDSLIAMARRQEISPAQIESAESLAKGLLSDGEHYGYMDLAQGDTSPITSAVVSALEHGGRYVSPAPLLSAAMESDIAAGKGADDTRPIKYAVQHFIDLIGDRPVTAISRSDVETWLASFNGSPATIKRRLGSICGLINRTFLSLEYDTGRNPFAKHRIKANGNGNAKRLPFNKAHLALIDGHLAGPRVDREIKHIVNMLRNTAGRLSEIAGLTVADCILDQEIPFISIRENSIRGVKSDAATRRVPLIGIALTAATEAVQYATERGGSPDTAPLFTCFDGSDKAAKALSTKCCNVIRAAGINSKRLVAHSWRHTMVEALRGTGIPDHVTKRIVGHSAGSVTDRYGSPALRLAESRDAITKAIAKLGDVDESIYRENERLD